MDSFFRCQETEREVDKLKQQLQTENMSRTSSQVEDQCFEEEEQWMSAESGDLQYRMEEEKTRVSGFGLQVSLHWTVQEEKLRIISLIIS